MRVFIYGTPGAGKKTLALALHRRFGWQVYHLDTLFFHPDGRPCDIDKAMLALNALATGETWIIEGNHGAAIDTLASRANRVVVLRLGRWQSLWRLIRRRFLQPAALADKGPGGGPPALPLHLIRYAVLTHPHLEEHHLMRIKEATSGQLRVFKDPSQVADWLSARL